MGHDWGKHEGGNVEQRDPAEGKTVTIDGTRAAH